LFDVCPEDCIAETNFLVVCSHSQGMSKLLKPDEEMDFNESAGNNPNALNAFSVVYSN